MFDFAVALGGGGARGIYHVGALKALLDMDINITAVAGTSIGSINGAVYAQGDIDKADMFWRDVSFEKIIDTSSWDSKTPISLPKNIIANRGLDSLPLRTLLNEIIDEERLRHSQIEFGLTAFSVTDRTTVELFKEDIPDGMIVDYLLASSCFPGFKLVEIDGREYIDGGVTNKIPVAMLIARGYRNIVAIDINGPGFAKAFDATGINVITVKNPHKLVGLFEFDNEKLEKTKQRGYLDTYKAFGKLSGRTYYFKSSEYEKLRGRYSMHVINGLEYCANILSMESERVYEAQEFLNQIVENYKVVRTSYEEIKEKIFGMNILELMKNRKDEDVLKSGLILPLLVDLIKERQGRITHVTLKKISKKRFEAASSLIALIDGGDWNE